nr:acyltransferase family protein [uncultured Capnocytophaga sp.]
METTVKVRDPLIDVLKGFAIILVVIGHASLWFSGDNRTNPLYVTIYAFHMPLFMFLSGYVSFNKRREINLGRRFRVLVIPFFVWFFISVAYHGYIFDIDKIFFYLSKLIYEPTRGMWFLWLLFWECFLLYIALKINKNHHLWIMIGLWGILIFTHRITGTHRPYYGLPELCWYSIYFILGYVVHLYYSKVIKTLRSIGWCNLVLFPCLLFWEIDENMYFLYSIRLYLLAFTGITASYILWEWLCHWDSKAKKILAYLGGISLEIYVTHYYFRFITTYIEAYISNNLYLNILLFTIFTIIGCDITQRLIKNIEWLRKILYGR